MSKTVLGVGHCGFDSGRISAVVSACGGSFENVATAEEALTRVKAGGVAVVIPNRVIGSDEQGGLKVVQALQADPEASSTPVALISGIADAQQAAEAAGAVPGIGKGVLETDEGKAFFQRYLG